MGNTLTIDEIMTLDFPERIKHLISMAKDADPEYKVFGSQSHQYKLNPPAPVENMRLFEEKIGCTLPEQVMDYYTKVSEGKAGPDYGIFSIAGLLKNNSKTECFTTENTNDMGEYIIIGHRGCTFYTGLIVKGDRIGEIIYVDKGYDVTEAIGLTFAEWMQCHFLSIILGCEYPQSKYFKPRLPIAEDQLKEFAMDFAKGNNNKEGKQQ